LGLSYALYSTYTGDYLLNSYIHFDTSGLSCASVFNIYLAIIPSTATFRFMHLEYTPLTSRFECYACRETSFLSQVQRLVICSLLTE
jgi:hypothetical protein